MNVLFIQIFFFLQNIHIEMGKDITKNVQKDKNKEEKSELIILNDSNFDTFVKNGENNRWLIIFYLETCYFCHRAIDVLNDILYRNQYTKINNIKFGKLDLLLNTKINFRFNISEVPFIFLVENNSMIELDSYPNEINILNFIEKNFTNTAKKVPIPKIRLFEYYYILIGNLLSSFVDKLNNILISNQINANTEYFVLLLVYIIICIIFWYIIFTVFIKCCISKKKEDVSVINNKIDNCDNNEAKNNINDKNTEKKFKKKKNHQKKNRKN